MTSYGATTDPVARNRTTPGRAWASLILGILIFLVPFATGLTASSFAYNDYVVGVVVVILAAISIWAAGNSMPTLAWLEGINTLLGIWTIIAAFVFANNSSATAANVILGIILVIVAAWDSYVGMTNRPGSTMTRGGRAT
jgi:hypothetical protein